MMAIVEALAGSIDTSMSNFKLKLRYIYATRTGNCNKVHRNV